MSKIIIIKNITIADLTNFQVKQKVEKLTYKYGEIPKRFNGVTNWPKTTNLLCWNCDRSVIGFPRFIPDSANVIKGNDECDVIGNFDKWACAFAYANKYLPKHRYWDICANIRIFADKFPRSNDDPIGVPAPDKTKMKQYCGDSGLTSEEYDELILKNSILKKI